MSKECIANCPFISNDVETMKDSFYYYGLGVEDDVDKLISDCQASYDCQGPELTEARVLKGIIRKRVETVTQYICHRPGQI